MIRNNVYLRVTILKVLVNGAIKFPVLYCGQNTRSLRLKILIESPHRHILALINAVPGYSTFGI